MVSGLGFSPALMKSCEAVTLDVRSYRSLNCYHTALTPLATGCLPLKLILACTTNKLLSHIVYVLLLMFVSELLVCFCSCEYAFELRILTLQSFMHLFFY